MKKSLLFIAWVVLVSVCASGQERGRTDRRIEFPDVPNYLTLKCDLHQHTVFSDGAVWPDIRVQEAVRDGRLDAIALTEHLEYQPHAEDIPHPDRNRSYELALEYAREHDLLIIHGSEITRSMPPGHANAIFIQDANRLLQDDALEAFREARRQGAFIFWNHPMWTSQAPDGIARLSEMHRMLIEERLLNGIEVVNETMVSEEALRIALDHGLTIMGTSDVHGLVDWEFEVPGGGHRPITLVFAEERTRERWKPEFQLRFRVLNALNFTENAPNVDTDRPHPIAGVRRSSFVPVAHQFSAGWSSSARACTRSGTRSTRSKIQNCATNTRQRRLACLSDVPRDQVVSGKLAPPSCQTLTCVNLF